MNKLSLAAKALRELGFQQVALNSLYKIGLKTGYFRLAEGRSPAEAHPPLALAPILTLPNRQQLLDALGAEGLAALLAEADEIVGGRYRQFGGDPVEIQLEPPGPLRHWSEHESGAAGRHPHSPQDIKYTWEPARFGWAFVLGRAYFLSTNEAYAGAFWRYFEIFERANPAFLGPNWMSGQEVGLRLMAFAWAGQVFAGSEHSSPQRLADLAASTARHASRIPASLLYARSQNNNHLLTEAAGLFTASLALPGHPQAARWGALGQKWLAWCFENQIDQHGEYVQHSSNYHRLMLQTALWIKALELKANPPRPLTAGPAGLALATHWLLSMLDPLSGGVPNLGANDGALVFPLAACPFDDFRPVASAAGRAFLQVTLPPGRWDEMALWYGLPRSETLTELASYPGDHLYAPNSWAMLRAVKYTSRPSHPDQLHLDLWWT